MANPSFILTALPESLGGTDWRIRATFYTSAGNSLSIDRAVTLTANTKVGFVSWLRQTAKAIDDAETAVVQAVKVPNVVADMVGQRYDATQGGPTLLADVDKPHDTGKPPAGGG